METITTIFNNKIFRIPDYQRGYSWQKSQLDDFWNDIKNLRNSKVHYTGMISVEEVDEAEYSKWDDDLWVIKGRSEKPYFIVDGQQRLTTIIILLWSIIESLDIDDELAYTPKEKLIEKYIFTKNDKMGLKSYIFGYHRDNPSYEFLKRQIFGQKESLSTTDKLLEETSYTNNLFEAKEYFDRKIKNYTIEEKNDLYTKISQQLKFDFRVLEKELDIFIVFETMNNRGKPLSNLEKLKNRLIYLSTLLPDSTSTKVKLRNEINESWKIVYKYLGLNKEEKKLEDDAFLQNHWIVFHRYDRREAEFYANDIFDRVFTSQEVLNGRLGYEKIHTYIDSISKAVKQWFVMFNPSHQHAFEISQSNDLLTWLKKQNIVGFKAFQPLVMAGLLVNDSIEKKIELIKSTEAYVFLIFNVSLRRSNTGTYHFNAKANELYSGDISLQNVINDLQIWIYGNDAGEGYFDRASFYVNLKDLFQRDITNGFGDWKYLKYLLFEYELSNGITTKNSDIKYNELSIKPIISPDNISKWRKHLAQYTDREFKYLRGSLGNYILSYKNTMLWDLEISDSKNLQAQINFEHWDYTNILERGLRVLGFMENRWNIDLGNDEQKCELLFLNFHQRQ